MTPLGGFCDQGWCWETPLPLGYWWTNGWADASGEMWLDDNGRLLHHGAGGWSFPATPIDARIDAIDGSSHDLFACAGGGVYHWDGSAWTAMPSPPGCSALSARPGEAWVIAGGDVWRVDPNAADRQWQHTGALDAITTTATDVWAVGGAGLVVHGDAAGWSATTVPTTTWQYSIVDWTSRPFASPLLRVHAGGDGSVWAVGRCDTRARFDGTNWTETQQGSCYPEETDQQYSALFGGGPLPYMGVGTNEVDVVRGYTETSPWFVNLDGSSVAATLSMPRNVRSITGAWSSGSDAWILASDEVYRLQGTAFVPQIHSSRLDIGYWPTITGMAIVGDDDVWAAGVYNSSSVFGSPADRGFIARRTASGWSIVDDLDTPAIAIAANSNNDVWILGDAYSGKLWHWNGSTLTTWSIATTPSSAAWFLAAAAPDDIWIGGDNLWHFDGNAFAMVMQGDGGRNLRFIPTTAARHDVWLLKWWRFSSRFELLHGDGNSWTTIPPPADATNAFGVAAYAPDNLWLDIADAAGHRALRRYDCTNWTPLPLPAGYSQLIAAEPGRPWAALSNAFARYGETDGWQLFSPPVSYTIAARGSTVFAADTTRVVRTVAAP